RGLPSRPAPAGARDGDRIPTRGCASYPCIAGGRRPVVRGNRPGPPHSEGDRDEPTPLRAPPRPRHADRERGRRGGRDSRKPHPAARRFRMSQTTRRPLPDRTAYLLNAYCDGELSRFARWRFELRLRRSPELQRELAALSRVGEWVRQGHEESPRADLW